MVWPQLQMTGHAAPGLASNSVLNVIRIFVGVNQYLGQIRDTHKEKQRLIMVNSG